MPFYDKESKSTDIEYILIKMSTRKGESGASKRKRRKLQESAVKNSLSIVQFLNPVPSTSKTNPSAIESTDQPNVDPQDKEISTAGAIAEQETLNVYVKTHVAPGSLHYEGADLKTKTMEPAPCVHIGCIYKENQTDTHQFLKFHVFEIPATDSIPIDHNNHKFHGRLFAKILINREKC